MPKKATDVRSLARARTRGAIQALANLMRGPKIPPAVRLAAANSLLDRGWGRPIQQLAGDPDDPLRLQIREIVRTIVDPNPPAVGDTTVDDGTAALPAPSGDPGAEIG